MRAESLQPQSRRTTPRSDPVTYVVRVDLDDAKPGDRLALVQEAVLSPAAGE